MKKTLFLIAILSLTLTSCSSDDNKSDENEYPKAVNIKFDITTTRNSDAIINRTIDNQTETENVTSLPYSFTYAQQEVNLGTYVKLTFADNGTYIITPQGSTWTDYDAELKITVGTEVVKTQTIQITEGIGNVQVDYTFE